MQLPYEPPPPPRAEYVETNQTTFLLYLVVVRTAELFNAADALVGKHSNRVVIAFLALPLPCDDRLRSRDDVAT